MRTVPCLIFDCDGVLADTERDGHLVAFNRMFAEYGLPVQWSDSEYKAKLRIGGGKERLRTLLTPDFIRDAGLSADAESLDAEVARWHQRKTVIYTDLIASGAVPARPGVARLTAEAVDAGWLLGIASTSAEPSVRAVLNHVMGSELARVVTVYAGDIVPAKKPAPDIYLAAVTGLGATTTETVVIEDSRIGLLAATSAGLQCLVTPSSYTSDERFTEAALVVSCLGDVSGEQAHVIANQTGTNPTGIVRLSDLQAILETARRSELHHDRT